MGATIQWTEISILVRVLVQARVRIERRQPSSEQRVELSSSGLLGRGRQKAKRVEWSRIVTRAHGRGRLRHWRNRLVVITNVRERGPKAHRVITANPT